MRAKISKWGNSLGVRFPKSVAEAAGLEEGQFVDLAARGDGVNLRRLEPRPSLDDLVAEIGRLGRAKRPVHEDWGVLPSEWPAEDWSDIAPSGGKAGTEDASR